MPKTQPKRMCIGCRGSFDKKDLIRIVRTPTGEIILDRTGKAAGRGAYICDNIECLKKCVKAKLLNKSFKVFVPEGVYADLLEQYNADKQ
ncbi:MAG: YlxR family protein [Clostridia bacterium]|nr:YlxR family protein [Clostridia bacterium]